MAVSVTIWHNPRCSKSRATLALLEERGIAPEVRLYLQDGPSEDELRAALEVLGLEAREIVRKGEAEFKAAGLGPDSDETALIAAMAAAPKLIERPIVFANGHARIGRPPEAVLGIL